MGICRIVTFKLDSDVVEKLDEIALRKGVTRSDVIREAIFRYLGDVHGGCRNGTAGMVERRIHVRRIVIA